MSKTPSWLDIVSSAAISKVKVKDVRHKTIGHEKACVSVCIATKGDGIRLKPFITFADTKQETKALDEEFKKHCRVASS